MGTNGSHDNRQGPLTFSLVLSSYTARTATGGSWKPHVRARGRQSYGRLASSVAERRKEYGEARGERVDLREAGKRLKEISSSMRTAIALNGQGVSKRP